jgi:tetratricopeptide (TPR) repeat protein
LLFYQLLIGELELRQGQPAVAFEVLLDAARRTRNEQLFRRAADIALQARAGDRALTAVRAWRQALPDSLEAVKLQLQIVSALNRPADAAEPLRTLLTRSPDGERSALIASIPRFFQQATDPKAVASMLDGVLQPHQQALPTRVAAHTTLSRVWLRAGDAPKALTLLRRAQEAEPEAIGPALAALDLMGKASAAESIIKAYLATPQAEPAVRLAYARVLTQAQRLGDAVIEVSEVTRQQPDNAPPWLMLGALHVELRHPREAEQALERYLALAGKAAALGAANGGAAATASRDGTGDSKGDDEDDGAEEAAGAAAALAEGLAQARMLLAQAAEQRQDDAAAEAHLSKIDQPRRLLEVQTRRSGILARQGRVDQAREMIRKVPERGEEGARAKLVAEAQILRDIKRWSDAFSVLEQAAARWPQDVDLLYEQAMVAEKINRLVDMETLLRRVMELKPDHQHAYNALGYSLADRGQRLEEARALIVKALSLAPGDPFITDSLGWVEFRLGRNEEALRLLREAYRARPDTEIAAHLGEVLWVMGRQDEARQIWREGRARDASNEVLRETLARLRQDL